MSQHPVLSRWVLSRWVLNKWFPVAGQIALAALAWGGCVPGGAAHAQMPVNPPAVSQQATGQGKEARGLLEVMPPAEPLPSLTVSECPPIVGGPEPAELLHVQLALKSGDSLRILAIGPWGAPSAPSEKSPPSIMWLTALWLKQAMPQKKIFLSMQGARGEQAHVTADRLPSILKRGQYDITLWQSGTAEAERNLSPIAYYYALKDGVERLLAANTDLVLVDLPYNHLLNTFADPSPYEDALEQAAVPDGVALFPRLDTMRAWMEGRTLPKPPAGQNRNSAMALRLRLCLARSLAHFILHNAGITLPPPMDIHRSPATPAH